VNVKEFILQNIDDIKTLRFNLHNHAEVAFKEFETKKIITKFLDDLNISWYGSAQTGVVANLNEGDQCIAIRADIDGLNINGGSHLCGHDYHMAIVLGTLKILKLLNYDKPVKFIFQPAEEDMGGALPMIKEGVLDNPKVSKILSLHVWPEIPVGTVEACGGPSMASVDNFDITYVGKGGHAATPHKCINPLFPATEFAQSINIKCRNELNPLEPNVVTVTTLNCGSINNAIADSSNLLGTIRTFSNETRKTLKEIILKTAKECGDKYNCTYDIKYIEDYPPLINDYNLCKEFVNVTKKILGENNVKTLAKTFAGEDFAFFANEIPALHFRLGICDGTKGLNPLHSLNFDANEDCIFYGIYVLTNFILNNN
jgi:hippurate hydrolase